MINYYLGEFEEFEIYKQKESSQNLLGYCAFLFQYEITKKIDGYLLENSSDYANKDYDNLSFNNIDLIKMFRWELPKIREYILDTVTKPWFLNNDEISKFIKRLKYCQKKFQFWKKRYETDSGGVPYSYNHDWMGYINMYNLLKDHLKTLRKEYGLEKFEIEEIERSIVITGKLIDMMHDQK